MVSSLFAVVVAQVFVHFFAVADVVVVVAADDVASDIASRKFAYSVVLGTVEHFYYH